MDGWPAGARPEEIERHQPQRRYPLGRSAKLLVMAKGAGAGPVATPLRVVVVDDSDDFRLIFRLLVAGDDRLEIAGEAGGGHEGVSVCGAIRPEVVVLDLAMPTMDGEAALPLIRERCPDARIVVFSAIADNRSTARLLAGGAEAVLTKGESFAHVFDVLAGAS